MKNSYAKDFADKSNDYLEGYVQAVESRPLSKLLNIIFSTDEGAKYEVAKDILGRRLLGEISVFETTGREYSEMGKIKDE